jgi:hypothetical protein
LDTLKGRGHLCGSGEGERMKWREVVDWIELDPITGFFGHGNKPSEFIKGLVYIVHLSNYQLLKNECSMKSFA